MEYFFTEHLTPQQYKELLFLYSCCEENDKIHYECPNADEWDIFILAYNSVRLVGCLTYMKDSEPECPGEASGIVLPAYRRKGIYGNMLSSLLSHTNTDIILSGKDNYPGISEFANALGYTYCNKEYLLQYESKTFIPSQISDLDVDFDEEDNTYYYTKSYKNEDILIGRCSVLEEKDTINIFDVFVFPQYRNNGYAHKIISDVLWDLVNSGKIIQLQVSAMNVTALKVYTDCGFTIKDNVIFYSKNKF